MATAQVTYTATGGEDTYAFSFAYLSTDHVKLYLDGVEDTSATFPTASSIQASAGNPAASTVVLVKRETPRTALLTTIANSGSIRNSDLNNQALQALYVSEEARDVLDNTMTTDAAGVYWDAVTKKISNVVDPTANQDAATKNYVDTGADSQVLAAATSAAAALVSENNAATSESNAATSASNAASSASAASTSASNASTSETNAASSASAASTSETNAATSETNAGTSETNAAASAAAALVSENNAATSESNASTSESNAATSASTASTQASNASTSASNAATSESNASTSETNAATSASNASTSETNAATSASTATTQASNASTSATNASNAQTAAEAAQTAAEAAQTAAEAAADNFDDTYLGSKTSDPTLDNDGDPLTAGDLYYHTGNNDLMVYNGSAWEVAAVSTAGFPTLAGTNAWTGDNSFTQDVGIGTSSPDGPLHVHTASAGTVTANANVDDLVVENSTHAGISILTPNTSTGRLGFGDPNDNYVGGVEYDHSNNGMRFFVNNVTAVSIDSNATLDVTGVKTDSDDDGSKSSGTYTPSPDGGNIKRITNTGTFAIGLPAETCTIVLEMYNDTGAGTVTFSGYTFTDGDSFTTTVGHWFLIYITRCGSTGYANVKALQ